MNEQTRNEIIRLHLGGAAMRRIAKMLRVSRNSVKRVIAEHEAARAGHAITDREMPAKKIRRPSQFDAFDDAIKVILHDYEDITAVRLLEKLKKLGFEGQYTIVRERLNELRPRPPKEPVIRFETGPGAQGQIDYSPYTIDFVAEGRRRVHAFSLVLGYSRRQYLRFVESQDFETTLREHVRAFQHLAGVPCHCTTT